MIEARRFKKKKEVVLDIIMFRKLNDHLWGNSSVLSLLICSHFSFLRVRSLFLLIGSKCLVDYVFNVCELNGMKNGNKNNI